MTHKIDYQSVDLPDNENYEEWTYTHRRAYILSRIRDVGHPQLMSQTELGEQFDVDQSTISRDVDAVAEYIDDTLGDRRKLTTGSVVQRCIAELLEDGEWKDAGKLALDYDEWVTREESIAGMLEQVQAFLDEHASDTGGGPGPDADADADADGPEVELTWEGKHDE